MGCVSPGHAVRAVAILHRLPQTGRAVRRLGCGLPAVAHQPECTHQTRPARHGAAICSGRPSALRAHHHALLRCAHPAFARHAQGSQRDSVRRGLAKIDAAKGLPWLQNHLDYCTAPLLSEPWVLDMDSTVKTLYGHQEGAEVGYNPAKRGPPSHAYHT